MQHNEQTSNNAISACGLVRRFGSVVALNDVSLEVRRGEFFALLGPSGCGKTTLLRIIAGLDHPDAGTLQLHGRDILSVPAHQRPVNTVFQSYALFPHLTVRENIAFGLRMKRVSPGEIDERVKRVLDLAQLSLLADRKPHQLSGGQKQRVALARAVVNEPEVLLLDEPLAALDVKLRRELQEELRQLQYRLGITFMHVTHDQDEALSLSDRLAVMDHGTISQIGTPREIYDTPRNRFVAQFVGGCTIIEGTRDNTNNRLVHTPAGLLRLNEELPTGPVQLQIRPERVLLTPCPENSSTGVIANVTYTGPETHLLVTCGSLEIRAVTMNNAGAARARIGDTIAFTLPADALVPLQG